MTFAPYQNDAQSMQIGELIFENQTDKVIVYGDIDIYKTAKGLDQAKRLKQVFSDIVAELEKNTLNDSDNNNSLDDKQSDLGSESQSSKVISNPFS